MTPAQAAGSVGAGGSRPVRPVVPPCRHDSGQPGVSPAFPGVRPACGLSAPLPAGSGWDTGRSAQQCTSDVPAADRTAARFTVPSRRASEPRLKTDAGRTETLTPLRQPGAESVLIPGPPWSRPIAILV